MSETTFPTYDSLANELKSASLGVNPAELHGLLTALFSVFSVYLCLCLFMSGVCVCFFSEYRLFWCFEPFCVYIYVYEW